MEITNMEVGGEEARIFALQSAMQNVEDMAKKAQHEALEDLISRVTEIDDFLCGGSNPTLVVALAVLLSNDTTINYTRAIQTIASSGTILLQQLRNYDARNPSPAAYQVLKIHFPEVESDTPPLYPDFTPTKIEEIFGGDSVCM